MLLFFKIGPPSSLPFPLYLLLRYIINLQFITRIGSQKGLRLLPVHSSTSHQSPFGELIWEVHLTILLSSSMGPTQPVVSKKLYDAVFGCARTPEMDETDDSVEADNFNDSMRSSSGSAVVKEAITYSSDTIKYTNKDIENDLIKRVLDNAFLPVILKATGHLSVSKDNGSLAPYNPTVLFQSRQMNSHLKLTKNGDWMVRVVCSKVILTMKTEREDITYEELQREEVPKKKATKAAQQYERTKLPSMNETIIKGHQERDSSSMA
ncbi:hypothetical protein CJ030_MR6G013314 [Morella rubra]|uniref:Uncharacterized protein n=1 Tax=Morella rubra TaxID=262757 RepID=A0A6A1VFC0_9ROSI|nr:hypothetical protein CJ030_MR6G013314 [Morella rubra]